MHYLIGNAVPAIVEGTELVWWGQGHHHQVVTGPGCVQENHHGSYGCCLAHRRALEEEERRLLRARAFRARRHAARAGEDQNSARLCVLSNQSQELLLVQLHLQIQNLTLSVSRHISALWFDFYLGL